MSLQEIISIITAIIGLIIALISIVKTILERREKPTGPNNSEFGKIVKQKPKNVWMATKEDTEYAREFPLEKRIVGIKHLTLMNFAASSFLGGDFIADVYGSEYKNWFFDNLKSGELKVTIILTNPNSFAAKDAALSRMNPLERRVRSRHDIIQNNLNILLDFLAKLDSEGANNKPNITIHLTDICLPYGIMLGEKLSDKSVTYMKVDLYSPLGEDEDIENDLHRPSFYLLGDDKLFDTFKRAVQQVKTDKRTKQYHYKSADKVQNFEWLLDTPFIHRGKINNAVAEHSMTGFLECIREKKPMEVDIVFLRDGTPLVGRDEEIKRHNGETIDLKKLSELSLSELREMTEEDYELNSDLDFKLDELLTLEEFLRLVGAKVDILIEMKTEYFEPTEEMDKVIKKEVDIMIDLLRYYNGNYAIHSANPYVLREFRNRNRIMVLGQISWSFQGKKVLETYREMHTEHKVFEEFRPDFISYKVSEIGDFIKYREENEEKFKNIPLLAWAVRTDEEKKEMEKHKSEKRLDNYMIEPWDNAKV